MKNAASTSPSATCLTAQNAARSERHPVTLRATRILGLAAIAASAMSFGTVGSASAATKTWITAPAASSTNWSTATNWGGTAPTNTDLLAFTNSTVTTLSNDISNLTLSGFIFYTNASAFTISGNAITLTGGITNNSASSQIINNNLTVNSSISIYTVGSGGNTTLAGNLSGSGTITQSAGPGGLAHTVIFGGTNSGFTGSFTQDSSGNNRTSFTTTNSGSAGAAWKFDNAVDGGFVFGFGSGTISFGSLSGGGRSRNNSTGNITLRVGDLGTSTTFSGQLKDNGAGKNLSLLKVGAGTLTLSGVNGLSGGVTVSNGAVLFAPGGSIASAAAVAINSGASLIMSNTTLGGQTFSGGLSGAGTITQASTNLMTFSGSSTYTGTYQVQAGAIDFQTTNAWGTAAYNSSNGVALSSGAAVIFGVTSFTNNLSTLFSTFTAGTGTAVFGYDTTGTNYTNASNIVDGTAKVGIASAGTGTLTLTGNNTFTGGVRLFGGTLGLTNVTGNGIGANTITVANSSTVNALAGLSLSNAMSFQNGSTLTLNNGGFNVTNSGNITNIAGSGNMSLSGAGTTTFSGSNNVAVGVGNGVTLALVANAANTSAGVAYVTGQIGGPGTGTSGYRFLSDSSVTFNGFDGAGGWAGGVFNFFAGNVTGGNSNGVISFLTNGTAYQNMTNNFDGTNGFSFALGSLTNVGTQNTLLSANSASVTFKSIAASNNYTLVLGGANTGYNAVTNGITTPNSKTTTLSKTGSGTWYVLGASTGLGNTTISGGTLVLGGTLNGGNYGGTISDSGALVMTNSAAQTLSGAISGTGSFAQSGTGTTTLSVGNSYSGGTTVNAGQLLAGAANAFGTGTLTVAGGSANLGGLTTLTNALILSGGTLTNGTLSNSTGSFNLQSGSVSAVLAGAAGATKSGSGTVTLSGNNTYSGTTTVSAGTLNVIGTNSGGGAVSVNAGGTLAGSGGSRGNLGSSAVTVVGGTTAANSGSISLNDGTYSTLTITSLTLGSGLGSNSILNFDAGASGVNPTNATIVVTGALTLNAGGVVINLNNVGNSLISGLTENLITFGSLDTNSGGTFTLANTNISFGVTGYLSNTATAVRLITAGSASSVTAYYSGGFGSTWTNNNGTYGNFTTDGSFVSTNSANNVQAFPSAPSTVIYNNATNVTSTLGQAFSIQSLNFTGAGTATISNDGNNLTVGAGGLNVSNGSVATVGVSLLGAGGVTNNGSLTLSGSNSFTGATLANSGTLTLSNTYALASSAVTVASNNALGFANGITNYAIGSLAGNGALNLTNASGAIALTAGGNNSNSTYSGSLGGTGSFTKSGTGTLTLSGVNSNTGGTTVSAGSLALGATNAIAGSGTVTVNGGQFDLAGYNQTLGSLGGSGTVTSSTGNGTLSIANDSGITVANTLTGGLALANTGAGTTTLSASNSYTGGTAVNAGTVAFGTANSFGTGTIVLNGGTILNGMNGLTVTNSINVNSSSVIKMLSGGNFTLSGNISGNGNISYTDTAYTGWLYLAGTNSGYSGTFTAQKDVNGNKVEFLNANAGSSSAAWVFNDNSGNDRLRLNFGNGTISFGSLSGSADIKNVYTTAANTSTIRVGDLNSNDTYFGNIGQDNSGTYKTALLKVGTGTLTLSGYNQMQGGITVDSGVLNVSAGGGGGGIRTALTINTNATVNLTVGDALGYNPGTAATTITVNGGTLNNAASNNNGYITSFVLNGGNVTSTGGGRFDVQSGYGVTSLSNSAMSLWSAQIMIRNTGNLTISNALGSTLNGIDLQISGPINQQNAGSTVTKTGNGTTLLSGTNNYTGTTTISGGTLIVSGLLGNGSYAGSIANSASLIFSNSSAQTLSGAISGAGSLNKVGSGTLSLTASNSFTGGATINGGKLSIRNASSLGSGTVTFTSNSVLSFDGNADTTVANNVTVTSGGFTGSIENNSGYTVGLTGTLTKNNAILKLLKGTFNVSGNIVGSDANSDLFVSGATATLSGNNTYNGPTHVDSGATLNIGSSAALPTSSDLILGSVSDTSNQTNSLNLGTYSPSAASLTVAGPATGSVSGAGTLTLSGDLTVSTASTLNLGSSVLGVGSVNLNGGTLLLNAGSSVNPSANLSMNSGTVTVANGGSSFSNLTLTGNSVINFSGLTAGSTLTFTGVVNGLTGNNTLSVYNYTPGGTSLIFSQGIGASGIDNSNLANFRFFSDNGLTSLGDAGGSFSGNEIVPVPEPSVLLAALFMGVWMLVAGRRSLMPLLRKVTA